MSATATLPPNPLKLMRVAFAILITMGVQEVASFSTLPSARYPSVVVNKNNAFSSNNDARMSPLSFTAAPTAARNSPSSTKVASTALQAVALPACIPTWAYYSLGHILGGNLGTPIVIPATKTWYKRIARPSWTPPNFVFGPTWTLLYGLMGVSVSRIVKASSNNNIAMKLWGLHYTLNLFWAPTFFGFQNLRLGLIINFLLLSTLGATLPLFHAIDPLSAYLQIPYLLWLIYATKLNQTICKLNPVVGGVNEAMVQADLCASGDGYNDAMLQYDIQKLQATAAKYAGL